MRSLTSEIKSIIMSAVNPAGIVKYNIVYIPRYNMYRVTLVSKTPVVDASVIANIIDQLKNAGYHVYMKTPRVMLGRTGVIILYVTRKAK